MWGAEEGVTLKPMWEALDGNSIGGLLIELRRHPGASLRHDDVGDGVLPMRATMR
jgi:hypothetical protein